MPGTIESTGIGPLQLGHMTNFLLKKKCLIMGHNLKNVRNGKSISKIAKLEFSTTFSIEIFLFFKIQTVIKSHSLMPGVSNLASLIFLTCLVILAFFKSWPILL